MAPSFVWNHFVKIDTESARCDVNKSCVKKFLYSKGLTSLIYHLKSTHNITNKPGNEKRAGEGSSVEEAHQKKQKIMLDFVLKPSLEEEVSRMIAMSNLSFNQIATDSFIRRSLKRDFPTRTIPKSDQGISRLMLKFHKSAKAVVTDEIQKLKSAGTKFSATLDEWTSFGNHRYMDVNLHYKSSPDGKTSFVSLGLFQIKGSCPAVKMVVDVRMIDFSRQTVKYILISILVPQISQQLRSRSYQGHCVRDRRWRICDGFIR